MPVSAEALALWAEVKANHAKLNGCAGPHDFVDSQPRVTDPLKYVCKLCGGGVDHHAFLWYQRGLAHGRKDPLHDPTI